MERPKIAVVDPNTLAVMGLRQMLQNVMPIMTVEAFGSFDDLLMHDPERFVHYLWRKAWCSSIAPFFSTDAIRPLLPHSRKIRRHS